MGLFLGLHSGDELVKIIFSPTGVDLHPVRGQDSMEYLLGLTPTGIVLYKKKKQIGSFIWLKVTKLKYKGSCFLLRANQGRNDEEKEYAFICTSKVGVFL